MLEALLCMSLALIGFFLIIDRESALHARKIGYNEGYDDCQRVHNNYEMSPDDNLLLAELKGALKEYIRANGLYERGDIKIIDKALDWKDYKDIAWRMTVYRKEVARGK